ncbi:hypothetical protein ANANG_G00115030 [Anguilla anguilla]|uniref:Uncharacterized protein n=1 Tax=Anguilla anguilla TaxID=7936 RepID=A0A9D3MDA8_ANGAN|nr:hypothetical protein ANANG_G00115030 [Anguilla anguilla]
MVSAARKTCSQHLRSFPRCAWTKLQAFYRVNWRLCKGRRSQRSSEQPRQQDSCTRKGFCEMTNLLNCF